MNDSPLRSHYGKLKIPELDLWLTITWGAAIIKPLWKPRSLMAIYNSVVTTRKMLETRPDTVKRFMAALLQGWREALDPANKEKAIKTVLQFNRETPEAIVRQQLPVTRRLMLPAADFPFGKIDTAAWKQTEDIMLGQKLIPKSVNVESLLKPVGEK